MLLLGVALGGGGVWLLLRAKIAAAYDRGRGEAAAETAALSEKVVAREDTIEELRSRLQEKDASLGDLQRQVAALSVAAAELGQRSGRAAETGPGKAGPVGRRQAAIGRRLQGPGRRRPEEQQHLVSRTGQDAIGEVSGVGPRRPRTSGRRPSTNWSSRSRNRWARWTPSCKRSKRAASRPTAA